MLVSTIISFMGLFFQQLSPNEISLLTDPKNYENILKAFFVSTPWRRISQSVLGKIKSSQEKLDFFMGNFVARQREFFLLVRPPQCNQKHRAYWILSFYYFLPQAAFGYKFHFDDQLRGCGSGKNVKRVSAYKNLMVYIGRAHNF